MWTLWTCTVCGLLWTFHIPVLLFYIYAFCPHFYWKLLTIQLIHQQSLYSSSAFLFTCISVSGVACAVSHNMPCSVSSHHDFCPRRPLRVNHWSSMLGLNKVSPQDKNYSLRLNTQWMFSLPITTLVSCTCPEWTWLSPCKHTHRLNFRVCLGLTYTGYHTTG